MKKYIFPAVLIFLVSTTMVFALTQDITVQVVSPTIITNLSISSQCILSTDNVTFTAEVTGYCVENTIFSFFYNDSWQNFSKVPQNNISSLTLTGFPSSQTINWTVYANDCFNITTQSAMQTFYINSVTQLKISPQSPDGLNNWYLTEPLFTLSNPDASQVFYRWGSLQTQTYSAPFQLEGSSNQGNITGGILELNYWSDVCSGIEQETTLLLNVDLANPTISDLSPANNSILFNIRRPLISALLSDVYGSNSGINDESIKMFLDNSSVFPVISKISILKTNISFIPVSDLSLGNHEVKILVEDNAGRESEIYWNFSLRVAIPLNLSVNSPQNISYNSRRVSFNFTASKLASEIGYIDYNDKKPKFRTLCRNCNEYGLARTRLKTLSEGNNTIAVIAKDEFGNSVERHVLFFVDSKYPRVSKITPQRNKATNGSDFSIKYTEENLKSISLIINSTTNSIIIPFQNCSSGKDVICARQVDLSEFNGHSVDYYFELSDGVNVVKTKSTRISVDTDSPILTIFAPLDSEYGRKVPFNVIVSENAELEYYDSKNDKWLPICSDCDEYGFEKPKTKYFQRGNYDLIIKAADKAGNTDSQGFYFSVDY